MNWKEVVEVVSTICPKISLDRPKTHMKLPGLFDQTPIQNTKSESPENKTKIFVSIKH